MLKHEAIYVRQSVDKKDSVSIESQIEFCKNEATGSNIQVYADRGFSGKNTNRPEFKRLMEDVNKGLISKIICYRLDRISRSIADFGDIWNTCQKHGLEFVSVNERFDTSTPVGRAMLYIIMVFAQLERETIVERATDNYYHRTKTGAWPGGPAPFGFDNARGPNGAYLTPNKDIATILEIFNRYVDPGQSLGKIAKDLNVKGTFSPAGTPWSNVALGRILRNPVYVKADPRIYVYYSDLGAIPTNSIDDYNSVNGLTIVGKRSSNDRKYKDVSNHIVTVCNHEGVIDTDTFLACQKKLESNVQIKNTGTSKLTWISGLVKCGKCGYTIKFVLEKSTRQPKIYMICSGRTNYKICDFTHSNDIHSLENYVHQQIVTRLDAVREEVHDIDADKKIQDVKNELVKVDAKIGNLISAISEATSTTMKYINVEVGKLEKEKKTLEQELGRLAYQPIQVVPISMSQFELLSFEQKRYLAAALIHRINLTGNNVEIVWKV